MNDFEGNQREDVADGAVLPEHRHPYEDLLKLQTGFEHDEPESETCSRYNKETVEAFAEFLFGSSREEDDDDR